MWAPLTRTFFKRRHFSCSEQVQFNAEVFRGNFEPLKVKGEEATTFVKDQEATNFYQC